MPSFPKPDHCERKATHDRRAKAFRDAVWKRDEHGCIGWKNISGRQVSACARCHRFVERGNGGEVDHVRLRSTHPESKYDPANGRIVCHACNMYLKQHPLERNL